MSDKQKLCPACKEQIDEKSKDCPKCQKKLEILYWEIEDQSGNKTVFSESEAESEIKKRLLNREFQITNRCRQFAKELKEVKEGVDEYGLKNEGAYLSIEDYANQVFSLQVLYNPAPAYGKLFARTTWYSAIFTIMVLACAMEKSDFSKAERANSIEAFQAFIEKYPQGKLLPDAMKKIHQLAYESAKAKDSIQVYLDFQQKYPETEFTSTVNERIQELAYQVVKTKDSLHLYREYQAKYPESMFSREIDNRIESILLQLAKKYEKRTLFPLYFNNEVDLKGSFTVMIQEGSQDLINLIQDRPGDKIALDRGGIINWAGVGSEIRVEGSVPLAGVNVKVPNGQRLCLKKINDAWVHVCGVGQIENPEYNLKEKLGYNRTVDICLGMLSFKDAIFREGAARDIGRFAAANDVTNAVPKLVRLLNDPIAAVRQGAAEGLGQINHEAGFSALKAAHQNEKNEVTKEFMAEALAIQGGTALFDSIKISYIPLTEAANYYSSGKTGWANDILKERIKSNYSNAVDLLIHRLQSTDDKVRLAAIQLLTTENFKAAKNELKRLAQSDPNKEVKGAAKDAIAEK